MQFKLSPSDFKYLWEDCKHCYYQKVVNGYPPPSTPFPSIFTKMNGQMQTMALERNLNEFIPELPSGKFHSQEGFIKSKPLPNKNVCYLVGRFDLLTHFDDGTFGVLDLKMTDPRSDDLYKFSKQLHAYKFALEKPAEGEPIKVSRMGLLIIEPQKVQFHEGHIYFRSKPQWHEIEEDMEGFYSFIDEVSDVLKGAIPEKGQNCGFCRYREKYPSLVSSKGFEF